MAVSQVQSRKLTSVVVFWLISATVFFLLLRIMALFNSNYSALENTTLYHSPSDRRSKLYDLMAGDLHRRGPAFLSRHGQTSQSLSLSDIFTLNENGAVSPVLKASNPAVRANVLYLTPEFSIPISEAVKRVFSLYFDKSIWFQNSSMYHFSMFHASHHITPVPADEVEIEIEADSVKRASNELCPLKILLDRVVLTSTGVLLGCWQVVSGTDPITIRAKLKNALPHAPEKQLYDETILHTSFARLLGPPKTSFKEMNNSVIIQLFDELVTRLNKELTGFLALVSELWYVEEYDLLALALDGRMKARKFKLGCSTN